MTSLHPVKIRKEGEDSLEVTWSDGKICVYSMPYLRKNCPCATCGAEKKNQGAFFIPLYTKTALTIDRIEQQGHYAIQIYWKDGHHTGIYDHEYLRDLCPTENGNTTENGKTD